jgi:hypothetical protein
VDRADYLGADEGGAGDNACDRDEGVEEGGREGSRGDLAVAILAREGDVAGLAVKE